MLNKLKHKQPFLFVDIITNSDINQITGEVNFNDNKFNYLNKVDNLDLLEASCQLAGIHLSTISEVVKIGFLSKIYCLLDFKKSFNKNSNFIITSTLQENIDERLFVYENIAKFNDVEVMKCTCGLIIPLQDTNINNAHNASLHFKESDLFQVLDNNNDAIKFKFNKTHPIFQGHFPNLPIVPGIYLVKIASFLLGNLINEELSNVKNAKFSDFVVPEEELFLRYKKISNCYLITLTDTNGKNKAMFNLEIKI